MENKVVRYIKYHKLNFFVIVLAVILIILEFYQAKTINALSLESKNNDISIQKITEKLSATDEKIDTNHSALNSKIDILDSAIKPDEKYRRLVREVRDAIQKNTTENMPIGILNRMASAIVTHSYTYNLTIAQVLAQIKAESNFNPKAVSKAGAKGLMQLMDDTADDVARELGKKRYNVFDINTNIELGCHYMAEMLDYYEHDYIYALRAYNFGPHNVDRVRADEADYSIIKEVAENGKNMQYLVDRRGNMLKNDEGQHILINNGIVPEEYRYPLETQGYIKRVSYYRNIFSEFGLDRVE